MNEPKCPLCQAEFTYPDGNMWVCPSCAHEWSQFDPQDKTGPISLAQEEVTKDAHGNQLRDGDSVILIKDLKIKGSSSVIKGGTKVKNIRLEDQGDGHNIACRIDGFGAINLKSEFVKKS